MLDRILLPSPFNKIFLKINNISNNNFKTWHFQIGMNFKDPNYWWGSYKKRKTLHEGIDIYCYIDKFRNLVKVDETIKFPLLFPGYVVQIFNDFQGKTIHIIHDSYEDKQYILHSMYGHIKLLKTVNPGDYLNEKSAIASVTVDARNIVPAHLHLTTFWGPKGMILDNINWNNINSKKKIQLIDPSTIL